MQGWRRSAWLTWMLLGLPAAWAATPPLPATVATPPVQPVAQPAATHTGAGAGTDQHATPLLPVVAGCFRMGQDEGGEPDERPGHEVCVKGFALERTEVTNEQYRACVKAKICAPPRRFGAQFEQLQQPVVGVSWTDARTYCQWLGRRLPTEAEWEYAARGPDSRRFPWGAALPDRSRATFQWKQHGPSPVGSHPSGAGPFGHLDLAGNVWEWVEDVYHPGYYPVSPRQDPPGGTCEESLAFFRKLRSEKRQGYTGSNPIPDRCERVLRGGAWNYPAAGLRSSNRVHHPPDFRIKVSGFRCAADAGGAGSR